MIWYESLWRNVDGRFLKGLWGVLVRMWQYWCPSEVDLALSARACANHRKWEPPGRAEAESRVTGRSPAGPSSCSSDLTHHICHWLEAHLAVLKHLLLRICSQMLFRNVSVALKMFTCGNIPRVAAANLYAPHTSPSCSLCHTASQSFRLHPSFSSNGRPLSTSCVLKELGHPSGTHLGGEAEGRGAGKTVAGQMVLWPGRTIIYCNSGPVRLKEREGEVAWRALILICLPPTPPLPLPPPIIDNSCAVWWLVRGEDGCWGENCDVYLFSSGGSRVCASPTYLSLTVSR